MNNYFNADTTHRLKDMLRLATISAVDLENKLIRCKIGKLESAWLPHPCELGKNFKTWRPLRIGTQVLLASPSGDLSQAQVVACLYSENIDAPENKENIDIIKWEDGTHIKYDSASGELNINVVGDTVVNINGNANINIKQNATIKIDGNADLNVGGNVNSQIGGTLDVKSGGAATITAPTVTAIGGLGVVTGECIDSLTGLPYADVSSVVFAKK